MSLEKINRVYWRLKGWHPIKVTEEHGPLYNYKQVRKAIMLECGTSDITIARNIKILKELDVVDRIDRWYFKLKGEVY